MSSYSITRHKFLSSKEARQLHLVSKKLARKDMACNRTTWVTRHLLVNLAFHTGLRVSEIAALKVGDLYFNGKENYLIVQRGKGGKSRTVYLDSEIVNHVKHFIAMKQKWKQPADATAPLLAGRGGAHFATSALQYSFKKALEEANLPMHYSIHSARHTYATLLLARSKNIRFVQRQLGHASLSMTSLYADVLPEQNQKLAEAILK